VVGADAVLWACVSGPPGSGALVEAASAVSLARTALAACTAVASASLARWTLSDRRVGLRAAAQGAWFWVMALDVLPAVAADALGEAPLVLGVYGAAVVLPWIALFAAAGRAFVVEGKGTLIPLDPPRRLVTTGPYAWIANPMQVAAVGAWLSLAALRGRWWLVGAAVVEVVYATGFAAGHEAEVLPRTLGPAWVAWRGGVRAWWPRWLGWAPDGGDRG
jgi:protein-S-isoprenylcysteine O-methyltransferase Ste14